MYLYVFCDIEWLLDLFVVVRIYCAMKDKDMKPDHDFVVFISKVTLYFCSIFASHDDDHLLFYVSFDVKS